MPEYIFVHPVTKEIKAVIQRMNEEHSLLDSDGTRWERVFEAPNTSIDTKWDANNPKDFINKTKEKKGTVGDLFDKSKELSEKRAQKYGADPVKQKYYKQYSKDRNGISHPDIKKQETKSKLDKLGFKIVD